MIIVPILLAALIGGTCINVLLALAWAATEIIDFRR